MIFSLHVHAHAFFAFTLAARLGESDVGWLNTAGFWVGLAPLLYLILAMRRVDEQGVVKSTVKEFLLLTVYSVVLVVGLVLLGLLALLLM